MGIRGGEKGGAATEWSKWILILKLECYYGSEIGFKDGS